MTIYALSSGSGISGLAVIRVSGKQCINILKLMVSGSIPPPRTSTVKKINKINTNETIDTGLVIWFPAPHSYTGEDVIEFHVHGSLAVIKEIQNSLSQIENCRLADPGEFTKIDASTNNHWQARSIISRNSLTADGKPTMSGRATRLGPIFNSFIPSIAAIGLTLNLVNP